MTSEHRYVCIYTKNYAKTFQTNEHREHAMEDKMETSQSYSDNNEELEHLVLMESRQTLYEEFMILKEEEHDLKIKTKEAQNSIDLLKAQMSYCRDENPLGQGQTLDQPENLLGKLDLMSENIERDIEDLTGKIWIAIRYNNTLKINYKNKIGEIIHTAQMPAKFNGEKLKSLDRGTLNKTVTYQPFLEKTVMDNITSRQEEQRPTQISDCTQGREKGIYFMDDEGQICCFVPQQSTAQKQSSPESNDKLSTVFNSQLVHIYKNIDRTEQLETLKADLQSQIDHFMEGDSSLEKLIEEFREDESLSKLMNSQEKVNKSEPTKLPTFIDRIEQLETDLRSQIDNFVEDDSPLDKLTEEFRKEEESLSKPNNSQDKIKTELRVSEDVTNKNEDQLQSIELAGIFNAEMQEHAGKETPAFKQQESKTSLEEMINNYLQISESSNTSTGWRPLNQNKKTVQFADTVSKLDHFTEPLDEMQNKSAPTTSDKLDTHKLDTNPNPKCRKRHEKGLRADRCAIQDEERFLHANEEIRSNVFSMNQQLNEIYDVIVVQNKTTGAKAEVSVAEVHNVDVKLEEKPQSGDDVAHLKGTSQQPVEDNKKQKEVRPLFNSVKRSFSNLFRHEGEEGGLENLPSTSRGITAQEPVPQEKTMKETENKGSPGNSHDSVPQETPSQEGSDCKLTKKKFRLTRGARRKRKQ